MEHHFNIEVAKVYGIEEAVIIHNLFFWIHKNKCNDCNFFDGRYWTYNSSKAFTEQFPYMSSDKIRRHLDKLVEYGFLLKGNYNKEKFDRTSWYAFSDNALEFLKNCQLDLANLPNGFGESARPIPYNKPYNKQYNKEEIKEERKSEFIESIDDLDMKAVFIDWIEYKKAKKQTYNTDKSLMQCYKNLVKLSGGSSEIAKAIVEQSIGNNYSGLFPLKSQNYGRKDSTGERREGGYRLSVTKFTGKDNESDF